MLLAALAIAAGEALALTPDEAYAAIPHRRIAFDALASSLPKAQSQSLERLFAVTDQGVVLRVESMRAHRSANASQIKRLLAEYDRLMASLAALEVSAEVKPARELVLQALADQRRFLASKPGGSLSFARTDLSSTPDVRQASRKLHGAYDVLMRAFPGEPARNKDSFFDHLCALDYL